MAMTHRVAADFFSAVFRGRHHIPGPSCTGSENVRKRGNGWCVILNRGQDLSSYDDDYLSRLLFLAHDRAVRVTISSAGMHTRISIHQRLPLDDVPENGWRMADGHPTLEQAEKNWRGRWPGNRGAS